MFKRLVVVMVGTFLLTSCAGLVESTRESLLGESAKPREKVSSKVKWVSKDQYDDLMSKYKELKIKHDMLKNDKPMSANNSMASEPIPSKNTETVDVFGDGGILPKPTAAARVSERPQDLEEELRYYEKAVALKENNKIEEALKIFHFLEKSTSKQLVVRAKLQVGHIYFAQKQFDLALQVYEGIIRTHSFSSISLDALGRAADCAVKLGLNEKSAQYESLLRDVFGIQV